MLTQTDTRDLHTAWLAEDNAGGLYLGAALRPWLRLGAVERGGFAHDAYRLIREHADPYMVTDRVPEDEMGWKTADNSNGTALVATWTAREGVQLLGYALVSSKPPGASAQHYIGAEED